MSNDMLLDDILKERARGESIDLPQELEHKLNETLKNLPVRKKRKNKTFRIVTTAAAATLIAVISLSAAFPAYARNMPVVSSVFQFLSDRNIIDKDYIPYSSDLNLSRTSNDVTVTINSIVYDGIDLYLGYTVESKTEMKNPPHILHKEFRINGKKTSFGSGGGGKFINKNTYVGVDNFHVANDYLPAEVRKHDLGGNINIPDSFIMDLNIREFSNDLKGKWDFKFRVSMDKIKNDQIKKVKASIDLSSLIPNLKVTEVVFTPVNTVIRTIRDNPADGNEITFHAIDDKGRELKIKGIRGSANAFSDMHEFYQEFTFDNIYDDTESVTFIPTIPDAGYWIEGAGQRENLKFTINVK